MMRARSPAVVMLLLALSCTCTHACIRLYGARHEVPHYSYAFVGLDWAEEFPTCAGERQSPIHIHANDEFVRVPAGEESVFSYGKSTSTGANWRVVNNGHTVQLVMPESGYTPSNASAVVKGPTLVSKFEAAHANAAPQRVSIKPIQAHFHTHSEHIIDGKVYPLEMHIVNFVYNDQLPACGNTSAGCAAVVGIMFELAEEDDEAAGANKFIDAVFNTMPENEGEESFLPTGAELDFDAVMPADRSYVTYSGSLTTPPCSESILWHVLVTPVKITRNQLHRFQLAVGETNCTEAAAPTCTPATRHLLESSEHFTVPAFGPADPHDGLSCRKLANGQNYREVQDRQGRPILFYAAAGVCDVELEDLEPNSTLSIMLNPSHSNATTSLTLRGYNALVAANMTTTANCSGAAAISAAAGLPRALSTLSRGLLLAAAALGVLLAA